MALTLVILGIGALLVPPFLVHTSANLLATRVIEEGLKEQYTADAGVEDALWHLVYGGLEVLEGEREELPEFTLNNKTVNVTVENEGDGIYKITSTATSADGSSTTIISYVQIVEYEAVDFTVFEYAVVSLGGNIEFGGNSEVKSDMPLEGDVHANGDVILSGNAEIDGDASATGVITISGNAEVRGVITPNASSLVGPVIYTQTYKTKTQDVECAGAIDCGDITRWGNWSPPPGEYGREHVQGNLNILGNGTWIFTDTVCAGITTTKDIDIGGNASVIFEGSVKAGRDLDIGGNGTVTFADADENVVRVGRDLKISGNLDVIIEGPVKVGGKLDISTNGMVTFTDTVCVEGDLKISSNASVTFDGPVKVEGDLELAGNNDVPFADTIYVEGDLKISGNSTVYLEGTVYVGGGITMTGNSSQLVGGEVVIAEGGIALRGNSKLDAEDIPFVVSNSDITITGNNWTSAIVYAPKGDIVLSGNSKVYGSVVGLSVTGSGNNDIEYPIWLRENLPDVVDGDDDEGGTLGILTYNINP